MSISFIKDKFSNKPIYYLCTIFSEDATHILVKILQSSVASKIDLIKSQRKSDRMSQKQREERETETEKEINRQGSREIGSIRVWKNVGHD